MGKMTRQQVNILFAEILNKHVHQYYKMISTKEVNKYSMNPVVWDSIRFDRKMKPPEVSKKNQEKNKLFEF